MKGLHFSRRELGRNEKSISPSSLEDLDYFCAQLGEIADTLRAARDNPEQRERRRWQDIAFCAAVIASSEERFTKLWLEQARDALPATLGPMPPKDAPAIAQSPSLPLIVKRIGWPGTCDAMFPPTSLTAAITADAATAAPPGTTMLFVAMFFLHD
jgi:hypothetical protein